MRTQPQKHRSTKNLNGFLHQGLDNFKVNKAIVTIGTFDGVHRGHYQILNQLKQKATEQGGESVVLTLWPHPRMIIQPFDNSLQLLNSIEEKAALLEKAGIDHLVIYPFTPLFSKLSSCQFIKNILVDQIHIHQLVVGYDHRFGHDRQGDIHVLRQCAASYDFTVDKVAALAAEGINISSTKIRDALSNGNVTLANQYLNYTYRITGKVVHGEQLGRKLGYPTANVKLSASYKKLPKQGVYAVSVLINTEKHYGMLSIGVRPTINNRNKQSIEVHIFDFNQSIYEQEITIFFHQYIREELKLENLDQLVAHMQNDEKQVKHYFSLD